MKSLKYYSLFLIFCCYNFVLAETLKPSNEKYDIVKITDENNKTRTYYHLNDNNELIFDNLEDFVKNKDAIHGVKIISRAKISPNSNSSKTFGITLQIKGKDDTILLDKELRYKKGISKAKKTSKSGFSYTQGGFWFENLNDLENSKILIKKMEGSPEVDVRVVIDEIKLRTSNKIIKPVNKEKSHKVLFLKDENDSSYVKTSGWNYLKNEFLDSNSFLKGKVQYKIEGPRQIRILSRSFIGEDDIYNLIIRENGRFMGDYEYQIKSSNRDAHCFMNKEKINLSNYNSFFINVPAGVNYYSIETNDEKNQNILVKLQSYIVK